MELEKKKETSGKNTLRNIILIAAVALAGYYFFLGGKDRWPFGEPKPAAVEAEAPEPQSGPPTIELTEKQLQAVKIGQITQRPFHTVKSAVGNVDFNQDKSTQVSSPYQGRIIEVLVSLGDRVKRDQPLFTIESPDLMAAASTLIQTAGVAKLAESNLTRLRGATKAGGTAIKDLDQSISDQQTAEGAYRAAIQAISVFGLSPQQIDQIVTDRKIDRALIIRSPVDGVVSARAAAPGLLVQPGNSPTPVTISDDSTMWLNAYVTETDALAMKVGDSVVARIPAAGQEPFTGKVTRVGSVLDSNTHRLLTRAQIDDPQHRLRAGMIATFDITTAEPVVSTAIPSLGVVREGDGSMTIWIQKDATHFTQRVIKIGDRQDGFTQILEGAEKGEPAIVEGAIFVDNILNAAPSD